MGNREIKMNKKGEDGEVKGIGKEEKMKTGKQRNIKKGKWRA